MPDLTTEQKWQAALELLTQVVELSEKPLHRDVLTFLIAKHCENPGERSSAAGIATALANAATATFPRLPHGKQWPKLQNHPTVTSREVITVISDLRHILAAVSKRGWPNHIAINLPVLARDRNGAYICDIFDTRNRTPYNSMREAFWREFIFVDESLKDEHQTFVVYGTEQPWLGRHDDHHLYS